MHSSYPGIRVHLGFYGPRMAEEPIAQMKPRLPESQRESVNELRPAHPSQRLPASRVEIRTEVNG